MKSELPTCHPRDVTSDYYPQTELIGDTSINRYLFKDGSVKSLK